MSKNTYIPLKNKNWLFPETGKEGFHFKDVSNAVVGLKKDLMESYTDASVKKFVSLVEKWFPDITEREQNFWMKQSQSHRKTVTPQMEETGESLGIITNFIIKEE
jgi:hypothetical protein